MLISLIINFEVRKKGIRVYVARYKVRYPLTIMTNIHNLGGIKYDMYKL